MFYICFEGVVLDFIFPLRIVGCWLIKSNAWGCEWLVMLKWTTSLTLQNLFVVVVVVFRPNVGILHIILPDPHIIVMNMNNVMWGTLVYIKKGVLMTTTFDTNRFRVETFNNNGNLRWNLRHILKSHYHLWFNS